MKTIITTAAILAASTATKGYADLTIGRARFYCQMK
jgi:hypothetical protein